MSERPAVRWLDPMLPGPWEAVYLWPEGWTVLAPWSGEGDTRYRPHVAEVGGWISGSVEHRAAAERIVAWCPQARARGIPADGREREGGEE